MKKILLSAIVLLHTVSCSEVKEKTRETLNSGGELVGKAVTEVAEGVTEGIDRTLQCSLELSPGLMAKGLRTGKFTVDKDSGGTNNRVSIYFITEKDFADTLLVRVFDKEGLETGRARQLVSGKAGNASYFDFKFDPRTDIEVRSRLVVE